MQVTAKMLYSVSGHPGSWDGLSHVVKKWWEEYAIRVNNLTQGFNDEQTDDSAGVVQVSLE